MKGKAIIFSAPSGAGKTTIVHALVKKIPLLRFSISATTRKPRSNETNEVDYHFLSVDEFNAKKENGDFLEWEEVYEGLFYGTLRSEVERLWDLGYHVIFDVDVKGGLKLKEVLKEDALSIFVLVNDPEVLRQRLINRKTESNEMLNKRVDKALLEMEYSIHFDSVIENKVLEEAVENAEALIKDFIS